MRTYKIFFIYYVLIQFVVCSDTIRFDQPDSVYINNALDSIIQNGQILNIEYALQSYGKGFKNIIYKRRYVDKIIDTVVVAPVKNILPKFLNRIVYRLP